MLFDARTTWNKQAWNVDAALTGNACSSRPRGVRVNCSSRGSVMALRQGALGTSCAWSQLPIQPMRLLVLPRTTGFGAEALTVDMPTPTYAGRHIDMQSRAPLRRISRQKKKPHLSALRRGLAG